MNTPRKNESSPRFKDPAAVEASLRANARASRVSAPSGLELSIAAAVRRDAADGRQRADLQERRSRRWFSPAFAGLATSACAIAAVVYWNGQSRNNDNSAEDIQYLVHAVQSLPSRIASADLPVARRIASADPLAREISSVRNDARNVIDFLAANFVPSQALDGNESNAVRLPPQET